MTIAPRPASLLAATLLAVVPVPRAADLAGYDCLIKPRSVADVAALGDGVLAEFLVARGDTVTPGQVVARLDRDLEQATVDLAEAKAGMQAQIAELRESLAFAERELARVAQLAERKVATFKEVDKAKTDVATARLRLEGAREEQRLAGLELVRARDLLERRAVLSPVHGVVMERLLAVGESARDKPILRIAEVDPLNVELIVPVADYGRLTVGTPAEVLPRYPGAGPHQARVAIVDPILDAASDTFGVRLELPNPGGRIPGGVRCEVRFLPADAPTPPR